MEPRALLSPTSTAILDEIPWQDPARAERLLRGLARQAGTPREAGPLLDAVLAALPATPDAEMALLGLERWASRLVTPASTFTLLLEHPRLLDDLLRLFGSSQYLSDILARDPWLYSLFIEAESPRTAAEYAEQVEAALRPFGKPEARREALRRVKRRELLRIGWRDIARRAPLAEIVREISDLADGLIQGALRLAREEVDPRFQSASAAVRFSVIGMGKLGARELNYSSDVDLVFLMDSPTPQDEAHRRYATRLAETLIQVLAQDTAEGRCFRVDMRLRPEGRSGALVRSYAAFREYYDRWAETWERQALIKARPVAGDPELGQAFMDLVHPVVYRRLQGPAVLQDVREMRAAMEARLRAAGEMDRNVKEGRGTIRDVEFTLQLIQLLFGADQPALQVPDTLTLLARMEVQEVLTPEERRTFEDGYVFFRAVEHRLQLLNDLPVRLTPTDEGSLRRLARSLDFPDAASFREAFHRHSSGVRGLAEAIHMRLGAAVEGPAGELRAALLLAHTEEGLADLRRELESRGFPAPEEGCRALGRLAVGPAGNPHPASTRRLFADLAPSLLDACARAADPSLALEGLDQLAARKFLYRAFFQTLMEHPEGLADLCRFAGAAPAAMRTVLRFPELSDFVTDQEYLARVHTRDEMARELTERLQATPSLERKLSTLRRFKLRELVRISARHVLQPVAPEVETAEWSDLAEVLVSAALELARERLQAEGKRAAEAPELAVFALGRFGGRDLHFSSDLDLLHVSRPTPEHPSADYEILAAELGRVLTTVTEEGPLYEVDLRLRPEGRQGAAVTSLESARRYYGEGGRGETWEFQTLTRLRPVAGSRGLAAEFREMAQERVYRSPMPKEWTEQIRQMKRRVERERVSEAHRSRHLKLGPGGLSDIEFLVQALQLRHGGKRAELRTPSTLEALSLLGAGGELSPDETETLVSGFRFLTRLRQTLYLLRREGEADLLPDVVQEPRVAAALARAMGFGTPAELEDRFRAETSAVRSIFLSYLG